MLMTTADNTRPSLQQCKGQVGRVGQGWAYLCLHNNPRPTFVYTTTQALPNNKQLTQINLFLFLDFWIS